MRFSRIVAVIVVLAGVSIWQGCSDGGNGPPGGGKSIGGEPTTTFLAYLDPTVGNVNVTNIPTSGNIATVTGSPYLAGSQPVSMAVTPDGKFLYAVNFNGQSINEYAIASDGTLSQPVPPTPTGFQPVALAIDSQERFAISLNQGASSLTIFSINSATGALAKVGTDIALNVTTPKAIAISGNFVYVASANAIDVLIYTPATTTFAFATGSPFSAGPAATNIVALYSPAQAPNVLYAADTNTNSLLSFSADTNGVLTAGLSSGTGTQPAAMIADDQNRFLFVANQASSNISVFAVDAATGALTPATTSLVSTGTGPNALAYDPVTKFLFVGLSGTRQIALFGVNTTTGALTSVSSFNTNNASAAMVVAKP
ncbi:MAG TPA: beta-propeller fold lactonase family protein [Terriglobales bacterium]